MDSEAGLLLPAGNFPYPPRVHFFNELRLFDVLEQMDIKYVLNTIPVTVGLTSANQGLISTPSATADLHQRGMQLESWVMKPWEPRINSELINSELGRCLGLATKRRTGYRSRVRRERKPALNLEKSPEVVEKEGRGGVRVF